MLEFVLLSFARTLCPKLNFMICRLKKRETMDDSVTNFSPVTFSVDFVVMATADVTRPARIYRPYWLWTRKSPAILCGHWEAADLC